MQKYRREKTGNTGIVDFKWIGTDIYNVKDEKTTMDAKYFKSTIPAVFECGGNIREIVHIAKLIPGNYCVVPWLKDEPDCDCEFLLRIYSERPLG